MSFMERLAGRRDSGVAGNVSRLLATLPGCAPAQPWLGIPADPGLGSGGLETLRLAVLAAVVHGEPRLRRVEVVASAGTEGVVQLVVRAEHGDGSEVALTARLGDGIVQVGAADTASKERT
jgi:hypothetical protein